VDFKQATIGRPDGHSPGRRAKAVLRLPRAGWQALHALQIEALPQVSKRRSLQILVLSSGKRKKKWTDRDLLKMEKPSENDVNY
jgi:hypothetical protein